MDGEEIIDELLSADLPSEDAEDIPPLRDAEEASRTLRRIRRIRRAAVQELGAAEAEIARLERFVEERRAHWEAMERFHVERLQRWHEAILRDAPERKTIRLPAGTLVTRAQQPEWSFDEAVFVEWAQHHLPSVLRPPVPRPPSIDRAAAKRLLTRWDGRSRQYGVVTDDGSVVLPPGVKVVERGTRFTVVIDEEEG